MAGLTRIHISSTASKRNISSLRGKRSTIFDNQTFLKEPRLKKRKAAKEPGFTIFEDHTATKAANPTPEEIKNDPEYLGYNDKKELARNTETIRKFTNEYVQKISSKYAMSVATDLLEAACEVDKVLLYTAYKFERRIRMWYIIQSAHHAALGNSPHGEGNWLSVEVLEELANIVADIKENEILYKIWKDPKVVEEKRVRSLERWNDTIDIIAVYCLGRGVGMDVGNSNVGDYLDDGTRNPKYYERLAIAWDAIVEYHVDGFLRPFWPSLDHERWFTRMKSQISRSTQRRGLPEVNWKVMEHYWGEFYPPYHGLRRFGQEGSRIDTEDWFCEEHFQRGIEDFSQVLDEDEIDYDQET